MNRRQLLLTACSGAIIPVAGCLGRSSSTVQLGGISVVNFDDVPKEVDIQLSKDDSTELDSVIELPAAEDATIGTGEREPVECAWDEGADEYVIEVGLGGEEVTSHDIADHADGDCVYVEIEIFQDDEINFDHMDCQSLAPGRRESPWGCPFLEE